MPKTIDRSHNPKPLVFSPDEKDLIIRALVIFRSDYATHREPQNLPDIERIIEMIEKES